MSSSDDPGDPHGKARPAILFVLPWEPSAAGGVNTVVRALMDGIAQEGACRPLLLVNTYPQRHVTVRTRNGLPSFYEYFLPPPFDAKRVTRSVLSYFARLPLTLLRFLSFVRDHDIRVVNLHYPGLSALTVLMAKLVAFDAFKVVLSFHGADLPPGDTLAQRALWRIILRRADAVVSCSQALADEIRAIHSSISVRVVHNAVDATACRLAARQSALPPGLEGRRYVLAVGKFERKKAHDVLIESFERIAGNHPDLHLAIIGASGSCFAACHSLAVSTLPGERIRLYRDVPHGSTLAAISRAALFVLPSRREPFGIVILEAAALGTPVVGSRVGGIPEIIQDGYSGILVAPDDVEGLAGALQRALTDPERSGARAARLKERVSQEFDLARQVRAYQQVYDIPPYSQRYAQVRRSGVSRI